MENLLNRLFSDNQEITKEDIDYYEKNPEELDMIANKEYFHVTFLGVFFLLGIGITIGARVISYFFADRLGSFIDLVILDVFSELGIAIFGGAVVAYLIEYLNKRQYQQNIKFRIEVKRQLEHRKKHKNPNLHH